MNAKTVERNPVAVDFAQPTSKGGLALVPPPAEQFVQPEPRTYPPKIAKALVAIAKEFGPVAKDGFNTFHKYNYQKWDDVLDRVSTLLPKYGLIISQSEIARSLFENDQMMSITYAFTIVNDEGEVWPDRPVWSAVARARDQKGVSDDKSANKCHTQAHKYFLLHTFNIKTKEAVEDEADSETPDKQITAPKPPKPGSAEAAALEGPREIDANGAGPWADAFIHAIESANAAETDLWVEKNGGKLGKLHNFPNEHKRVADAIARRKMAPKPPRPGAAAAPAPTANPMPNPVEDAAGWIVWLATKFNGFTSYEEGELYWNEIVSPTLDGLPQSVQEDAMGVWNRFEEKYAP